VRVAAVRDIATRVNAGTISASDILVPHLAAIAECNSLLNALVDFDPEEGLRAARAIDRRIAAGEKLPLAGVPVAIKDNIWVARRRVTQGSRLFREFCPSVDAIAVERLKVAGAVVIGMANTSVFACKGVTTNRVYGLTRHHHSPDLTPGGSSGGPVVAVAAGTTPLAPGTDAGGSSRRPPAHVGVVGFKPSFGAIPYGPGFAEPYIGLSVIAPIAASVDDVVVAFDVLSGADARDPESAVMLAAPDARTGADLVVAHSPCFGLDAPIDEDVAAAIQTAVERLAAAGARITRRDPRWPAGVNETALMPLQHAGLASLYGEAFTATPDIFDSDIAVQIESGLRYSGAAIASALRLSADVARSLAEFFADADLVVGSTTPCVAWRNNRLGQETIGGKPVPPRGHAVFSPLFNHAKVPAISIPCGVGRQGLPVGLQIVGPRGFDR
jgi:aspartyl-tRNA(Asn)/glutamyl-tRNA(Gln) amidotransferase subunit A